MQSINSVDPIILIFDLDETLFCSETGNKLTNPLSASAEKSLSSSSDGIYERATVKYKALERKKMAAIFSRLFQVIDYFEKTEQPVPLAIKIITASSYNENYAKNMLTQFYNDRSVSFHKNMSDIEYFNRKSLSSNREILMHDFCTEAFKVKVPVDVRKAQLMDSHFPRWQAQLPNLERKNVFLIDNAIYNTLGAELLGFSALHYPSTPLNCQRLKHQSFNESENVFKKLDQLISVFEKSVTA